MLTKLLLTPHALKMTTLGVALISTAMVAQADEAADYPTKPIQFLVAAGAGGGVDNFARVVRPMFEEALGGARITVVNLPAASGALAHQRTANGRSGWPYAGLCLDHLRDFVGGRAEPGGPGSDHPRGPHAIRRHGAVRQSAALPGFRVVPGVCPSQPRQGHRGRHAHGEPRPRGFSLLA